MNRLFFTMVFLLGLAPCSLSAQPDLNAANVDRNVVFGMCTGLALVMDVYYAQNPKGWSFKEIMV